MEWIKHRLNSAQWLRDLNPKWGVEIDLRSNVTSKGMLHLSHDPWSIGEDFEKWLFEFKQLKIQGTLILNTKEDGLETRILELMNEFKITNYFFLDTTIPTLVKWTPSNSNFAIRLSKYEPEALANEWKQLTQWLWLDCFDGIPIETSIVRELSRTFRICLVSPELQGKPLTTLNSFIPLLPYCHAVCTKDPTAWEASK